MDRPFVSVLLKRSTWPECLRWPQDLPEDIKLYVNAPLAECLQTQKVATVYSQFVECILSTDPSIVTQIKCSLSTFVQTTICLAWLQVAWQCHHDPWVKDYHRNRSLKWNLAQMRQRITFPAFTNQVTDVIRMDRLLSKSVQFSTFWKVHLSRHPSIWARLQIAALYLGPESLQDLPLVGPVLFLRLLCVPQWRMPLLKRVIRPVLKEMTLSRWLRNVPLNQPIYLHRDAQVLRLFPKEYCSEDCIRCNDSECSKREQHVYVRVDEATMSFALSRTNFSLFQNKRTAGWMPWTDHSTTWLNRNYSRLDVCNLPISRSFVHHALFDQNVLPLISQFAATSPSSFVTLNQVMHHSPSFHYPIQTLVVAHQSNQPSNTTTVMQYVPMLRDSGAFAAA